MRNSRDPVFHVPPPSRNEEKDRNVLLLDDEDTIHRLVGRLLRGSSDVALHCVHTCGEATEILEEKPAHLLLIDVGLGPSENGLSFLKSIREHGFEGMACVLSEHDSAEVIMEALLSGADSYLVKGDLTACLLKEVRRLLGWRCGDEGCDRFAAAGLLRSFGLNEAQVRLLSEYVELGFPSQVDLCDSTGLAPQTLSNRFCRIERRLGFEHRNQLVRFLTVASGFGARLRLSRAEGR